MPMYFNMTGVRHKLVNDDDSVTLTVTMTAAEARLFKMACAHAGIRSGALVSRWSRRYLARFGIKVGTPTDAKEDTL